MVQYSFSFNSTWCSKLSRLFVTLYIANRKSHIAYLVFGLFGFSARICNLCRHHIFVKFFSAHHLYLDCVWCDVWFNICPVYVFIFFFSSFLIHFYLLCILGTLFLFIFELWIRWTVYFYLIVAGCWDARQYFWCTNMYKWPHNIVKWENRSQFCYITSDCFVRFFLIFFPFFHFGDFAESAKILSSQCSGFMTAHIYGYGE